MTNRTVQIYGYGFGPSDATTTVSLDGVEIFNGSVTTVNQSVPPLPNLDLVSQVVPICSFELPVTFSGTKPMTCQVTNGTIIFAQIQANYGMIPNPVYTEADWAILKDKTATRQARYDVASSHATPAFSQADETALLDPATPVADQNAILSAHGVSPYITTGPDSFVTGINNGDARSNVYINGVAQSTTDPLNGTLWWTVSNGSTLSYDLNVTAGTLLTS